MAFDQNQSPIPKDLSPINIVRNVIEDPRIGPVASSGRAIDGYYASPPADIAGSPGGVPAVYYPAAVPDAGFVPLGFSSPIPAVTRWVQHVVASQPQPVVMSAATTVSSLSEFGSSPKFGIRQGSHASDQNSEDGGDESASCRKVKLLCSFGGKILPRLSDGALRYVGGHTRIIYVRKDVTFGEFTQKMADTSEANVLIKYQLPDEDLDALVSVSCAEDLENMMDEFQKLIERSPDRSAKLRIFLFSPLELESAGLVHVSDVQDSALRYVEAVNGMADGFNGGAPIARKESIESSVSAPCSDNSGFECADGPVNGLGDATGLPITGRFYPNVISSVYSDTETRIPCLDASTSPLAIPMIKPGTAGALGATPEHLAESSLPISVSQALPGASFPATPPAMTPFIDSRQGNLVHANYVQVPSQIGYPAQILGPVFSQPPLPFGSSHQFAPTVQYTMDPPFLGINPNAPPAFMQPQQMKMEHYPRESVVLQRVGQLPAEQAYSPNQTRVPLMVPGGVYNQVQLPEQIAMAQGQYTEMVPRFNDCFMCQNALPHAHSDTLALDTNGSVCNGTDLRSPYRTFHLDDQVHPVTESNYEQLSGGARPRFLRNEELESGNIQAWTPGVPQNIQLQYADDKVCAQKAENLDLPKAAQACGVVMPGAAQYPCGMFAVAPSQPSQNFQIPVLQTQTQAAKEVMISRPVILDHNHVAIPQQSKDFPGGYPFETSTSPLEQLMQIDGRLENLRTCSGEVFPFDDHNISHGDNLREEMLDTKPNHVADQEEQINQRRQSVAEDVANSLLQSPSTSDASTISQQNDATKPPNFEMQQRDKYEELKTRVSEKINFGFPTSGIGRLQIIKNSDLEELRELGCGTFGTVFHGKWRGTDVAIKRINDRCFSGKTSEQDRMREDFWNEAIKLADLHHPNVVAFYGVVLDGPDDSVATVTEYMVNGSLRNALQRNGRLLDKRKRLLIAMDVAFGMEYLHGKNIVHFDLKSDNLLVNLRDPHRPICKVSDLGLSKVKCQTLISGGVRGTLPWMAPELLYGSSSLVSEKVDVFSFGIVMWELLTGNEPYADLHYGAIIGGIVSNTLRPPVPESCDMDWRALMERCWSSEPSERPNFTEVADELRAMASKLQTKAQTCPPAKS